MDSLRGQLLKFVLMLVGVCALIVAFLRWQYVDVITVADDSMAPTLLAGDQAFLWRGEVQRGDIAVCAHPRVAGQFVLGRVTATAGMSLELQGGQLAINNTRLDRDFRGTVTFQEIGSNAPRPFRWGWETVADHDHLFFELPDRAPSSRPVRSVNGHYLISDNRAPPIVDSRVHGALAPGTCLGSVFMRWTASGRAPSEIGGGTLDLLD